VRSFAALRQEAGLFCGSFLRKGEVFAYVGLIQNPKDLTHSLGGGAHMAAVLLSIKASLVGRGLARLYPALHILQLKGTASVSSTGLDQRMYFATEVPRS